MMGQSSASVFNFLECRMAGQSQKEAYSNYLNGKTSDGGSDVSLSDYLGRGYSLIDLQDKWLSVWDPKD